MPSSPRGATLDIYARVSRLSDDRMRSTDAQVAECRIRLDDLGAIVGVVFVDPGRSAWNPRVKRLEWHQLMDRLESGQSDGVIVWDLARFSRRPIEGERLIAAAERGLIILDSESEYDLTSPSGKKAFRDQMSAAAYESDRTSKRSQRGKRAKAMLGESNHSRRPFGFEADGMTPREPEASERRAIIARVIAGESHREITADLNGRGILTSQGGAWSGTAIRNMVCSPRNAGLVAHKGEVVGKLPVEAPLVERHVWEQAVAVYTARRRGRPNSRDYTFSGAIHCGACGHHLSGRPAYWTTATYADGGRKRQYYCARQEGGRGGCGKVAVDLRLLEERLRALVVEVLSDPRHAAAIEEAAAVARSARLKLAAEIAALEATAVELAGRLGRGEISLARHDAAVGPLDRRLAELRAQLEGLPAGGMLTPVERAASRAEWFARWDAAEMGERRRLLRQALAGRRLVVDPALVSGAPVHRFSPTRVRIEP